MHGKDEFLQAVHVLAPRFRFLGILLDNENAGRSAICIHRDLLQEDAIVMHVVACQGLDYLVNIRSCCQRFFRTWIYFKAVKWQNVLFTRIGLYVAVVWAFFGGDLNSVIRKKDDLMRWRPGEDCWVPFFLSTRLWGWPNLIRQEETSRPLESCAPFQGLVVTYS